jgi:hypothetical protein
MAVRATNPYSRPVTLPASDRWRATIFRDYRRFRKAPNRPNPRTGGAQFPFQSLRSGNENRHQNAHKHPERHCRQHIAIAAENDEPCDSQHGQFQAFARHASCSWTATCEPRFAETRPKAHP